MRRNKELRNKQGKIEVTKKKILDIKTGNLQGDFIENTKRREQ